MLGVVSYKVFGINSVVGLKEVFSRFSRSVQSFEMINDGTITLVSLVCQHTVRG